MRNSILFFILVALSILISFVVQEVVFTEDVYYASLGEQLSTERIESLIKKREEWSWIRPVITLLVYSLKIFLVAICLLVGLFVANKKSSLASLLGIIIKAEFIFLIPSMVILIWFGVFKPAAYSFSDIRSFAPLSLLNFFDTEEIDSWLMYPLRSVNVFEFLYVISLAHGLSAATDSGFLNSFKIAFASYGIGLLLWIVFIVFMIVSFTM